MDSVKARSWIHKIILVVIILGTIVGQPSTSYAQDDGSDQVVADGSYEGVRVVSGDFFYKAETMSASSISGNMITIWEGTAKGRFNLDVTLGDLEGKEIHRADTENNRQHHS